VEGDVTFSGGLRIDGAVHGKVATVDNQPATLVLSEQARVEGEVHVSHVVINGAVSGPVTANDYLELQAKARVNGDVVYRTLEMHVGAVVQGKLMHSEQESAAVVELKRATGE
jgi:cytoskeletal protein CcmA (bactofilin family)